MGDTENILGATDRHKGDFYEIEVELDAEIAAAFTQKQPLQQQLAHIDATSSGLSACATAANDNPSQQQPSIQPWRPPVGEDAVMYRRIRKALLSCNDKAAIRWLNQRVFNGNPPSVKSPPLAQQQQQQQRDKLHEPKKRTRVKRPDKWAPYSQAIIFQCQTLSDYFRPNHQCFEQPSSVTVEETNAFFYMIEKCLVSLEIIWGSSMYHAPYWVTHRMTFQINKWCPGENKAAEVLGALMQLTSYLQEMCKTVLDGTLKTIAYCTHAKKTCASIRTAVTTAEQVLSGLLWMWCMAVEDTIQRCSVPPVLQDPVKLIYTMPRGSGARDAEMTTTTSTNTCVIMCGGGRENGAADETNTGDSLFKNKVRKYQRKKKVFSGNTDSTGSVVGGLLKRQRRKRRSTKTVVVAVPQHHISSCGEADVNYFCDAPAGGANVQFAQQLREAIRVEEEENGQQQLPLRPDVFNGARASVEKNSAAIKPNNTDLNKSEVDFCCMLEELDEVLERKDDKDKLQACMLESGLDFLLE